MLLGPTVRTIVDFESMPPRHAIRASAPAGFAMHPRRAPEPPHAVPEQPARLQLKLQALLSGMLNTVRPFPDALVALREYFRGIQELEFVE
jgi:hypothetical protein